MLFCCGRADVGISDPAVLEERCSLNVHVIETEISDNADRRRICLLDFLCSLWKRLDFDLYFYVLHLYIIAKF